MFSFCSHPTKMLTCTCRRVSAYWLAIDGGALDADFDDNYQEPQMDVEVAPAPAPVAAPANVAAARALSSPSASSIKTEVQNVVLAPVPIASPVLLRSKSEFFPPTISEQR